MLKVILAGLVVVGWLLAQGPRQSPQVPDRWKVWADCGDGLTIYHSDSHTWADVPNGCVQVVSICQPAPAPDSGVRHVPRRLLRGSTWYWMDDGGIPRQSLSGGLPDGVPANPPVGPGPHASAKGGRQIDAERLENYRRMAVRDFGCELP